MAYGLFQEDRILDLFPEVTHKNIRVVWLRHFSEFVYENKMIGSVAECGVFRGDFSRYINEFFPDRTLYLFDSFRGFRSGDIDVDGNDTCNSFFLTLFRGFRKHLCKL